MKVSELTLTQPGPRDNFHKGTDIFIRNYVEPETASPGNRFLFFF